MDESSRRFLAQAKERGICVICERPLPPRRWWQKPTDWVISPPPMCLVDKQGCYEAFAARLRGAGA